MFHDKAKRTQQGNLLAPYVIFLNFGTPPVKSMPTNASICDKKWPKWAKICQNFTFSKPASKKSTQTQLLCCKEEAAVTREWLEVALKEASKAEVRMFKALI